jgi:quinol monooxygenase YgiN
LVLARLSTWTFKKGKREEGFSTLDLVLSTTARNTRGFRGSLALISRDNPNAALFLTMWSDEESLNASETGVFKEAMEKAQEFLEKAPAVDNYRVFSAELKQ